MESGPLPPHERTWRHPSELAAEEHALARAQVAAPSTRWFAITTGSVGLLAVGLLMLSVTPRGTDAPVAISATTTPPAVDPVAADTIGGFAAARSTFDAPTVTLFDSTRSIATPIGEGQLAVVTPVGVDARGTGTLRVQLASGQWRSAQIVGRAGESVLVELAPDSDSAATAATGLQIAEEMPGDDEIVTVLASPPVTVALRDLDDLGGLDVGEGTAVIDADGELVGLCSRTGRAVRLVEVADDPSVLSASTVVSTTVG